jgi:hypothetical protein
MKSVYDMAKQYYPSLWSKERLKTLVQMQKLTVAQYEEITQETYTEG